MGAEEYRIAILSLETGDYEMILEGSGARYSPTGHLIYTKSGTLMAAPFDLRRLEVVGDSVPFIEGVATSGGGWGHFDFSEDGTLVYVSSGSVDSTLVLVDRQGKFEVLKDLKGGLFQEPRFSPNGEHLSVTVNDGTGQNIWLYEIERGILTPFTFGNQHFRAIWTPDGQRLTFHSHTIQQDIFWKSVDGSGEAELLTTAEDTNIPTSWSDREVLAYSEGPLGQRDILMLSLEGDREPQKFLATQFDERHPMFSPDGQWIAFTSNQSGQDQIYVKPYVGERGILQISTDGGSEPMWGRNGRQLFYRNGDKMMVTSIQIAPTFKAETPRLLFEGRFLPGYNDFASNYDVTEDNEKFVMVTSSETSAPINVVLNWFEELKRLVPTP